MLSELEAALARGHALTEVGRLEANLSDALKRNRELKAELRQLHYPRTYSTGVVRCPSCAVWQSNNSGLRRADWPCPTAVAAGIEEQ